MLDLKTIAKKMLSVFLCAAMLCGTAVVLPVVVPESDTVVYAAYTYNGFEYVYGNNDLITITKYTGSETEVTIPSDIYGDKVVAIDSYAFNGCKKVKTVTISENITSIRDNVFYDCTSLSSIFIPSSVTYVATSAFKNCNSLTNIYVDSGNNSYSSVEGIVYNKAKTKLYIFPMGKTTFNIIPETLTNVDINGLMESAWYKSWIKEQPDGDIYLGNVYLKYKGTMPDNTTVDIKDGTKGIADNAFASCSGLVAVNFPDSLEEIGMSAFDQCICLKDVYIPDSVVKVGIMAFESCRKMETIRLSQNLTAISMLAFAACKSLKSVTIPEKIQYIDSQAFDSCESLESVELSEGLISIYSYAFENCNNLSSVTIPSTVTHISDSVFYHCKPDFLIRAYRGTAGADFAQNNTYYDYNESKGRYKYEILSLLNNPLQSITLNKQTLNMNPGNKETLIVTFVPSDANDLTLKWESSDSSVAEVADDGTITAKAPGKAVITASSVAVEGVIAQCSVVVSSNPTSITLDFSSISLTKGNTKQLTATVLPSDATNKTVTWTTSNSAVATVLNGKVTAKGAGKAVITAKTSNGLTAQCTVTVTDPTVAVTSVSLSKTSLTLGVGESATVTATVNPSNATDKTLIWTSSNTAVATVSSGKITAKKAGTATITAKTKNGKSATCTIAVKGAPTSITLNKTSKTIGIGENYTLKATLSENSVSSISWTSSSTAVATVKDGKVTAKKAGTATITAKTANGKTAKCTITVKAAPSKVTLSATSKTIGVGEKLTLKATLPDNTASGKMTWTSSITSVATVKDGKVTGKKAGKVTITVKTFNGKTATCSVTVKNAPGSVSLDNTSVTLGVGETLKLKPNLPSNTASNTRNYQSSNTSVATYSGGKITAKKAGTATVTVTLFNGKKATCKVTVKNAPSSITLSTTSKSIEVGKSFTLSASLPSNTASYSKTWSSSNESVATVSSSGKVTAKKIGTTTITVKTFNGKKATCKVTVKAKPLSKAQTGFKQIAGYIEKYGKTNSDGYKFIKKTVYLDSVGNVDIGIVYNDYENSLNIIMNNSNYDSPYTNTATLSIVQSYSSINTCKANIIFFAEHILYESNNYGFNTISTYSPSSVTKNSNFDIEFVRSFGLSTNSEYNSCANLSETLIQFTLVAAEYLLVDKGFSLSDLGYSRF